MKLTSNQFNAAAVMSSVKLKKNKSVYMAASPKRKGNKHADAVESTSGGGQRSISSSEMKLRPAVNVDTVNGDEGYTAQDQHTVPDTDRGFNSARPRQ